MTPNPRRLSVTLKHEGVDQNRRHTCYFYNRCLDTAQRRDWPSFSCAQCSGLIAAGDEQHDAADFARALVWLIIGQSLADIEVYLRLVNRIGRVPVFPYSRYGKEAANVVKDYERSRAFFLAPVTIDGQPYRSYCEHLMLWAGIQRGSRTKKIMNVVDGYASPGENLRVARNHSRGGLTWQKVNRSKNNYRKPTAGFMCTIPHVNYQPFPNS